MSFLKETKLPFYGIYCVNKNQLKAGFALHFQNWRTEKKEKKILRICFKYNLDFCSFLLDIEHTMYF